MVKISKKNFFDNLKDNCEKYCNRGFKGFRRCSIFGLVSLWKLCALGGIMLTLVISGVGPYGLLVLILLILLFIFLP